ncbi:hypothetical protein P4S72_11360 [Vibrio sp. PP-XX7]
MIIKASGGGGGRGMRVVRREADLIGSDCNDTCRSESSI